MRPPPHPLFPYHHLYHHRRRHRHNHHHRFRFRPYPIRPTHMPRMGSQLRAELPPPSHRRSRRHHQDMEGRTPRRTRQGRLRYRRRNGERVERTVYRRVWEGRRKSRHGRCTSFLAFPRGSHTDVLGSGMQQVQCYLPQTTKGSSEYTNVRPLDNTLGWSTEKRRKKKTNSVIATYARSWSLLGSLAAEEPPLEDGLNGH